MHNSNNKSITILLAILIAGASVLYRSVFVSSTESLLMGSETVNSKIEQTLSKLDSTSFDMAVFNNPKFQTFESIEAPLPSVPKGRTNPFAAILGR